MRSTVTLTFGDQAENHVGMQKIGNMAENGFDYNDLIFAQTNFERVGCVCEMIKLHNELPEKYECKCKEDECKCYDAYALIIRKGVEKILQDEQGSVLLLEEQDKLEKDKKAFMYGRVVNKHARHNLCFDDIGQEPDYENGLGRIIPYSDVPLLDQMRNRLRMYFGNKANDLKVEGNYYYDVTKCGIGYHGDSERKRVIGVRLGATMSLHYQWFHQRKPVGNTIKLSLNNGDMYVMSEKATGFDWKRTNVSTLRHAAGASNFLKLPTL
jgi:alkylated DNA repair dioxygenase AlkB